MECTSEIEKRVRLRKQTEEWFPVLSKLALKVTCEGCKQKVNFWYMCRCYYCGFFYCRPCAGEHFSEKIENHIRA